MRDPDNLVYFREEVGGLCMGGYERDPDPWSLDGVPPDFNGKLLPPDWPRFEPIMEGAVRRVPAIADAEITRLINGPEAFTPDNEFILGESAVRGFFVAAGFCAHGIAGAGGIGRSWRSGSSTASRSSTSGRWTSAASGRSTARRPTPSPGPIENYATYYDIHYPNEERQAGRPAAPLADLRARSGAGRGLRREVGLGAAQLVRSQRSRRRRGAATARLGRPALVAGHRRRGAWPRAPRPPSSTRSSFAKIEIVGPGRPGLPAALCDNEMDRPVGSIDLHPDAQPPRRHRVRLHGHAAWPTIAS